MIVCFIVAIVLIFGVYGAIKDLRETVAQGDRNNVEELRKIRKALAAIAEAKQEATPEVNKQEEKTGDTSNDTN